MSAFNDHVREIERSHHRLIEDLQRALTVLAFVPKCMLPTDSLEEDAQRREMLRLARLYADPALVEGIAYETVIDRLSEGLA